MEIRLHNDGKKKYQSFEARLYNDTGIFELVGYGATKEEAIKELKQLVDEEIAQLLAIDYENIAECDWQGKLIQKTVCG